ncbi:MAG: hypothetical protein LBL70_01560 [Treponema sp.]|nr:hypothetical protein [Treponema sp.]
MTGTSPYSGWVEERFLLNSANKRVGEAIEDIRASLPFPLTQAIMRTAWSLSTGRFGMVPCQADKGDSEQTLSQEQQLFCGTEELRCGAEDGGVFPV